MKAKTLTKNAIIAAIYIVLTLINPFSFGIINLRVSGALELLPFFQKKYTFGIAVGLVIANMFSSLGLIDVCVALLIIAINYVFTIKIQSKMIRTIIYVISSSVIISAELHIVLSANILLSLVSLFISQIILSLFGYSLFSILEKRWGNGSI